MDSMATANGKDSKIIKIRTSIFFLAIYCFLAAGSIEADPIVNGGFETDSLYSPTWTGNTGLTGLIADLTGVLDDTHDAMPYSVGSDDPWSHILDGNVFSFEFHQDRLDWGLDDIDVKLISGVSQRGYWLFSRGSTPDDFSVLWNSLNIGPSLVNAGSYGYQNANGRLSSVPDPEPASLLFIALLLIGTGAAGMYHATRRNKKHMALSREKHAKHRHAEPTDKAA
jgi:hypothetical protein